MSLSFVDSLLLRRRRLLTAPEPLAPVPEAVLATGLANLHTLGFAVESELLVALRQMGQASFERWVVAVTEALRAMLGEGSEMTPMYPGFPKQVMEASEGELYLNAYMHYLGDALGVRILPALPKSPRPALDEPVALEPIGLGTVADADEIGCDLVRSASSLSEQDYDDLGGFLERHREDLGAWLPEVIPHREVRAWVGARLLEWGVLELLRVDTATDVLRLAVAASGGDVSLAKPTRFRSFRRAERRSLLALLDGQQGVVEDMLRHRGPWVRLGERLHPFEYRSRFANAATGFDAVRNGAETGTFAARVEAALSRDPEQVLALLRTRPGELARRLDVLLRRHPDPTRVVEAFSGVAESVAAPVLLQVRAHFIERQDPPSTRVFFPKGQAAKVHTRRFDLPPLPAALCAEVVDVTGRALVAKFSGLPPLGRVYVDPALDRCVVPFSQRSASRALRTLARGSRVPLPDASTLRLFLWWKEGPATGRADVDLAAVLYGDDWSYISHLSYTQLRDMRLGAHSGDITSAPNGAAEYIDLHLDSARKVGVRWMVATVMLFSRQSFDELPECFMGWMGRSAPDSGEVFEPRTVVDRFDLSSNARIFLPAVVDVQRRELLFLDLDLKRNPRWQTNVESNLQSLSAVGRALSEMSRATVGDLMRLHAMARGTLVATADDADVVCGLTGDVTPFMVERLLGEFMGAVAPAEAGE